VKTTTLTVHHQTGYSTFVAKILVVDDEQPIVQLMQFILEKVGHEVWTSYNGAEALETLGVQPKNEKAPLPDLILLDLMMPRVNGYEFIEQIGETYAGRRPHIVVFTAAGKRGVDKIPASAVCNAILKPFDLDKFIEIIADCLDKSHTTN